MSTQEEQMQPGAKRDVYKVIVQTAIPILLGVLVAYAQDIKQEIKESNDKIQESINELAEQVQSNHERITRVESWKTPGNFYYDHDAIRDIGVLKDILKRDGETIDDHEMRIRKLEDHD